MWWFTTALALTVDTSVPANGDTGVPTDAVPFFVGEFDDLESVEAVGPAGPIAATPVEDGLGLTVDLGPLEPDTSYTVTLTPAAGAPVTVGFATGTATTPAPTGVPTIDAVFADGDCSGGGLGMGTADFVFPLLQPFELAFVGWVYPDGTDDISWVEGGGSGVSETVLNSAVPFAGEDVCVVAFIQLADGSSGEVAQSCVVPAGLDCDTEEPEPEKGCGCVASGGSWASLFDALAGLVRRRR